jgi:hypothetical protein
MVAEDGFGDRAGAAASLIIGKHPIQQASLLQNAKFTVDYGKPGGSAHQVGPADSNDKFFATAARCR